jgi:multidrug efflux pump
MRCGIWLDPAKLNNYGLTPVDVSNAISAQNVQIASVELGGLPSGKGQQLNATIIGPTRLHTSEQFGAILLKVNTDGSQVRLHDVARIGLGSETYTYDDVRYNGNPAAAIGVKLATGANALDTAKAVHATIDELKPVFPARTMAQHLHGQMCGAREIADSERGRHIGKFATLPLRESQPFMGLLTLPRQ